MLDLFRKRTVGLLLIGWVLLLPPAAPSTLPSAQLFPPTLVVSKSPQPASLPEPGGAVTFTITLVNPLLVGSVQATALIDNVFGNITTPGHDGLLSTTCSTPQLIPPLERYTCSFVALIIGNANEEHKNTLTVYAQDNQGEVVAGTAEATVLITDVPSSLAVKKVATPEQVPESGAEVLYTVAITNTSAVDSIQINRLRDDRFGDVGGSCERPLPVTLPAQGRLNCTFRRFLQGQAGTTHTNVATANGRDDDGNPVSAAGRATVLFLDTPAVLTVTKTATPTVVPEAGGTVTFTVAIRNASSADAIEVQSLVDDQFGNVSKSCQPRLPVTIPREAEIVCRFVRTVQGNLGTVHRNVVTAAGVSDDGQPVAADAEAQVTFSDSPSQILLQKSPSQATVSTASAVITFAVQLDNISLADAVTLDRLVDSSYGDVTTPGAGLLATDCIVPQTLPSGGQYRCRFSALIGGAVGNEHSNQLTAFATDDDNSPLQAQATATVTVVGPLIQATKRDTLLKDADGNGYISPGDTLGYTVLITNTGNGADSFTFVDVIEANAQLLPEEITVTQGIIATEGATLTVELGPLAPAEVAAIHLAVQVVELLPPGVESVRNQGLVRSSTGRTWLTDDPDTTATSDPTVTPVLTEPALLLTKWDLMFTDADGDNSVSAGDTLLYRLRIVNGGNARATDLVLVDLPDAQSILVAGSVQVSSGLVTRGNAPGDASVVISLPTLLPQQQVDIAFRVLIQAGENRAFAARWQLTLINQARVTFTHPSGGQVEILSDDPDTAALQDATQTPIGGQLPSGRGALFLPMIRP
jgi:uncharacterized repeat protein (TIGR01451 family)